MGIGLGDVLKVGAHEDQAAGAPFAFADRDAGLGAVDLAFEGFFPEALSFQKLFFPFLQFFVVLLLLVMSHSEMPSTLTLKEPRVILTL